MKENKYNKEYWLDLQQRYFDAETTDEEERLLKSFAASTDDNDFSELQAVMGFACAKKKAMQPKRTNHRPLRYAVAAAVVAVVVMIPFLRGNSSDCMMIAEGKTTTNQEVVMDELDKEMAMIFSTADRNSIESDMDLIFN